MKTPTQQQLNDPAWWDENAPEGATHFWGPSSDWYRVDADGTTYAFYDNQWRAPCHGFRLGKERIHRRPTKPAAPEWDGEGLPPVGSTQRNCELVGIHGDTGQFEVVAHRNGAAIVYVPLDDNDGDAFPALPCHFLPIRTQAEREREELANCINSQVCIGWDKALQVAGHIITKYEIVHKGDS